MRRAPPLAYALAITKTAIATAAPVQRREDANMYIGGGLLVLIIIIIILVLIFR